MVAVIDSLTQRKIRFLSPALSDKSHEKLPATHRKPQPLINFLAFSPASASHLLLHSSVMLQLTDDLALFLLSSALVALLFSWVVWILVRKSRSGRRPKLPPGPPGLPLVGNLPFLDPELHIYFAKLARDYGPILTLRLGTKIGIVVTSQSIAREVLKDHDVTFANRDVPAAGKVATYGGRDIAWTPYGPEWRMLRKICVREMLSNPSLDSVYALRRRELRRTINYFYERVGSPVNIGEQMFLNVLNVITNMLWGGTVKGEERGSLGAEFRQVVAEITELLGKPNISDFFPGLARLDLQGIQKQMSGLIQRFDRMFERMIDQRLKMDDGKGGEGGNNDFLQMLLKLNQEGDSGETKMPLTMAHVKSLLLVHESSIFDEVGLGRGMETKER